MIFTFYLNRYLFNSRLQNPSVPSNDFIYIIIFSNFRYFLSPSFRFNYIQYSYLSHRDPTNLATQTGLTEPLADIRFNIIWILRVKAELSRKSQVQN